MSNPTPITIEEVMEAKKATRQGRPGRINTYKDMLREHGSFKDQLKSASTYAAKLNRSHIDVDGDIVAFTRTDKDGNRWLYAHMKDYSRPGV